MSASTTTTTKTKKQPGPDHPITIERSSKRVIVKVSGKVLANTTGALSLKEASYPAVHYIPRQDVDMSQLARTDHETYCPYKGDASYFSITTNGDKGKNAVWTYEHPYDAVSQIKEYLAFYPDRVDSIEEES